MIFKYLFIEHLFITWILSFRGIQLINTLT
nr:MAG TPA: hypothetical protein [Caudoviricetes sp.]